jgi:CheY-like chemotaxis protein
MSADPIPLNDPPARGCTILMIEDSATMRRILRRLFEREMPDAKIIEAAEGRAALREMTRCRADLIITDLQMPGMDGRSFIGALRSNQTLRRKNVLVLSSDDVSDMRRLYADDAGILFLPKPSTPAEILRAARVLLRVSPAAFAS